MASIGFVLALVSVVDTYISRKMNQLNQKALAVLCASIFKERGECKVEGDGMVIFIKENEEGNVKVAFGVKREDCEVHN